MILQGIDCSAFQGNVNWKQVKAARVDFAMLCASLGGGHSGKDAEERFRRHAADAAQAGIHTGAYHCLFAVSPEQAYREAEHFLRIIRNHRFSFPVAVDVEDRTLHALSPDRLDFVIRTWCGHLRASGYYPLIRASLETVYSRLSENTLREFDLWLLRSGSSPDYDGRIGIWQYTAAGQVDGVPGRCGCSSTPHDYPAIVRDSLPKPPFVPSAPKPRLGAPAVSPLLQAFDTLSELAVLSDVLQALFEDEKRTEKQRTNQTEPVEPPATQEPSAEELSSEEEPLAVPPPKESPQDAPAPIEEVSAEKEPPVPTTEQEPVAQEPVEEPPVPTTEQMPVEQEPVAQEPSQELPVASSMAESPTEQEHAAQEPAAREPDIEQDISPRD